MIFRLTQATGIGARNSAFVLNHDWNLQDQLEKIDAVLWVAIYNLFTFNVAEIVFQNLFTK